MALIGSINASNDFGFKNRIINGQMQVAQRANSATITAAATIAAGYSTVDRFYVYSTGANVTAAQVDGAGATKNRLRITGAASVTAVGIGQRIEANNSYDLAGSTATLSADLAISATLTTVTWTASYANTADTFGTVSSNTNTQIATGTFTVTPTVTNFNAQITIPAAATTGIQILFTVGALTAGLTWTVGNVQLEKGSTATSFDYRPFSTELALCQRYFEKSYQQGTSIGSSGTGNTGQTLYIGTGNTVGTGDKIPNTTFKVVKRTAPDINIWSPNGTSNRLANMAGTDLAASSCTPNVANDSSFFAFQNSGGSVSGTAGCVQFQWSASAEL